MTADNLPGRALTITITSLLTLTVGACGSDETGQAASSEFAETSYTTDLTGVCPENIVVQTGWYPETTRAYLYQLIGPGGTVDIDKGAYVGPLGSTGVNLDIRMGGPYVGDQSSVAMMYQDPEILLGEVNSDEGANLYSEFPTVALFAPMDKSPAVLVWDPSKHDFKTMAEIGESNLPVLMYGADDPWVKYFVGKGDLKQSQIDDSYDGTPTRLIASDGEVIEQGYANIAPYAYEHDYPEWRKPVSTMLLADNGWSPYDNALGTTPENVTEYSECFAKLIPLIQQGAVDYATDPGPINDRLVSVVDELASSSRLTAESNQYSAKALVEDGLISNGEDATLGNFDDARMATFIEQVTPFLEESNPNFEPVDPTVLYSNQFIDLSIGMPQ